MNLRIDQKIFEQYPDLKLGVIIIRGLNNTRRISPLEALLRGICAQRGKEFKDKDLSTEPAIQVWQQAYGNFGVNPNKFKPSIAALLKRVKSGKEIPHVNALVDLYNYFSLKYLLPIGGEDLDWLCGDLNLTFTRGGEPFRPILSIDVERAKEGEVAYMDQGGITCRYWNHRECERTKFTTKTTNAVLIIEDLTKTHMDEFGSLLREMQNCLIKYIGGQIEPYILTEEHPEIDFGVEGRKNADDSKIPQQEIAHFMAQAVASPPKAERAEASPKPTKPTKATPKEKKKPSSPSKKAQTSQLSFKDNELLAAQLKEPLKDALKKAFPEVEVEPKLEYPNDESHGDYASNIALQITKDLNLPPQEIAAKVIENLNSPLIEKAQVAGPGFINIFVSQEALQAQYSAEKVGENKTVIVEYSQPNIAKPLGVHHLLSTIIGQSLYNIYKYLGFNAISINHIGDWGTQFGKLIYAYKTWGDKGTVEKNPIPELQKLYVKFHDEAEKDPKLEDFGRHEFKIFEEGDEENHKLWQWFVDESMKEVRGTYDKLGGIHFDYNHGESFYEEKMPPILEDGKKRGIIEEGKEGAYVINFEDPNIPTVPVQKKDGATLYITRDFATLKYRIEHFDPVQILYVVDIAQSLHFKQIFEACNMLGFHKGQGVHVWFGRMHMKDGKMSTRKGNIVLLDEVLDEAVKRALEIVEEKSPNLESKEEVARALGIGAIKYNILSQNRTTDITFDWDTMLSLDGNSAPYLQYTYARAKSILRKSGESTNEDPMQEPGDAEEKTRSLIRLFPKFPEQLIFAAREYKPNIVSNYLYNLAQKFNSFYNTVPVLRTADPQERAKRLQIVERTSDILQKGLALLGVEVVEEM